MTKISDGGPAFASPANQYEDGSEGMSLRDWFAGQAAQGALAGHFAYHGHEAYWDGEALATYAFSVADAMLAARDRSAS